MKARHYAEVAGLALVSFAVGLVWGRNWPATATLFIGALAMMLIMGALCRAKLEDWKRWHHRQIDRTRAEYLERGWEQCENWHHRQRIGGNGNCTA